MIWITKNHEQYFHTHYYVGFSSVCGSTDILTPKPLSYTIKIHCNPAKFCDICQKMLKSQKIHQKIKDRKDRLEAAQQEVQKMMGTTLQNMILNRLTAEDNRTASISELKKLFRKDYPDIFIEDVLIFLLVSKKIKVEGDCIIASPMETTHVK